MTLKEAIDRFDRLYPNALDYDAKRKMLSDFDGRLFSEVLVHYQGMPLIFIGYGPDADPDTELLAEFPFDDLYIKLLCAENDAVNGDTARYNNDAALFNASYAHYADYVTRTYARKPGARVRL